MVNVGILLVLAGSTAVRDDLLAVFLLGLGLLALETFEFKSVPAGKLVTAEIMISLTVAVATATRLIMSSSFKTPQVFMLITLLGAILVAVETIRKYADL